MRVGRLVSSIRRRKELLLLLLILVLMVLGLTGKSWILDLVLLFFDIGVSFANIAAVVRLVMVVVQVVMVRVV